MLSDIIVAIMCVIAVAAGIFAWWVDNGGSSENINKDKKDIETKETERAKEHENN